MNFDLSDDQVALRDGVRRLCEGRFDLPRIRKGFDRSLFAELADAGLFSLRADGFGWPDVAIAFQELGRALVPGPLTWSHLAHGQVDGIVGGLERPAGDGPILVEHPDVIDHLAVLDDDGIIVVAREVLEPLTPLDWPLDPLTPVSRATVVPDGPRIGDADLAAAWRQSGALLTAAYQVGMAQACVDRAGAYALERHQFARPIGSFQAVKHLLADMAVRAEVARAAVDAAACTVEDPTVGDPARAVSSAKVMAGDAARLNAKGSLQVHGGMGFTWDVDVHLYLKRAWVLDTVFGTPDQHADAVVSA
ncbi:MAG TPA: acyl-CoA dehydrogenase family protein [Acidimicrobiia bacterium]|nr:acyl-CoA dehydrogenase family protein [Acidimicrobiia bacterium]